MKLELEPTLPEQPTSPVCRIKEGCGLAQAWDTTGEGGDFTFSLFVAYTLSFEKENVAQQTFISLRQKDLYHEVLGDTIAHDQAIEKFRLGLQFR